MPPEAYPQNYRQQPLPQKQTYTHKKLQNNNKKSKEPPQQKCYNSNTLCLYVLKETDIMIKQAQNKIQSTTVWQHRESAGLTKAIWVCLWSQKRWDCQKGVCHLYVRWQSPRAHAQEDRRRFNKLATALTTYACLTKRSCGCRLQ